MCTCILCKKDCECGKPSVCDLHDLTELSEKEATELNLYYGGNFYSSKEEEKSNE